MDIPDSPNSQRRGSALPAGMAASTAERLPHFCGARVTVHYANQSGLTDSGRLSYFDDHWIEVTKDSGERILAPTTAIRIIKLIEPAAPQSDSTMLLRAASAPPTTDQTD